MKTIENVVVVYWVTGGPFGDGSYQVCMFDNVSDKITDGQKSSGSHWKALKCHRLSIPLPVEITDADYPKVAEA